MKSFRRIVPTSAASFEVLILAILLLSQFSNFAEPWPAWLARYGPPSSRYSVATFAVDTAGDVVFAGPAQVYTNGVATSNLTLIAKADVHGAVQWAGFFPLQPGQTFRVVKAVAADSEGGWYVAGNLRLPEKIVVALTKYSADGKIVWSIQDIETNGRSCEVTGIAVSDTGQIFLSGREFAGVTGQNFLVISFAATGEQLWRISYDGPASSHDSADTVLATADGGCIAGGNSMGVGSGKDYLAVRFDEAGNILWVARHDSNPSAAETLVAMTQDWAGNVYATGTSAASNGLPRCVTIKYDSQGRELWVAHYAASSNVGTYAVALTTDLEQNVFVAGRSGTNTVTVKYGASGEQLWAAAYNSGSGQPEFPAGIVTDSEGRVYVAATLFRNPEGPSGWVSDAAALLGYGRSGELFVQRRYAPCLPGTQGAIGLHIHHSGDLYAAAGDSVIKYSSVPPAEFHIEPYRLGTRGFGFYIVGEPARCYRILTFSPPYPDWSKWVDVMNATGRIDFPWDTLTTRSLRLFRILRLE